LLHAECLTITCNLKVINKPILPSNLLHNGTEIESLRKTFFNLLNIAGLTNMTSMNLSCKFQTKCAYNFLTSFNCSRCISFPVH